MKRLGSLSLIGLVVVGAGIVSCDNTKSTDLLGNSKFFSVRVDPQSVTLAQGATQQLSVTAYDAACNGQAGCNPLAPGNAVTVTGTPIFKSLDTTIAKVSASGVITAQPKAGSTSVIGTLQDIPGATSSGSVTLADTTPVVVLAAGATPPAVSNMTLTSSRNTNGAGSTDTLTITYTDAAGAPVATQRAASNPSGIGRPQFYSSDPSVATVGATGIVTGVKPGTATITAVNSVGGVTKTASFPITITDPISGTIAVTTATSGTGIIFFPGTLTVSATEAIVEGKAGAVVNFGVVGTTNFPTTFTATTTPNNVECFNVVFANPTAALNTTQPPGSTVPQNTGNIGDPQSPTNPRLCTDAANPGTPPITFGKDAQARLFTTPGTYTFVSTTAGSVGTGTLIVK